MPPRRQNRPTRRGPLRTLDDDPLQDKFAVLWWGPPGTGKTTNLAYMANGGPVAYIRADRSVRARPLRQLGVKTANIQPIDELDTEKIVSMVYSDFMQRLEEDPASLYGVGLDTISELIARRMEGIVDDEWDLMVRAAARQKQEPDKTKRYFVDRDYWQPITQEMRRIVRHLKDLNCHLGITAQTRRDTDENSGTLNIGPSVNPAFQGDLLAYMDFSIRTATDGYWQNGEDQVFLGYPKQEGVYLGKDREHVLPRILVEPTFDRVLAYALGELDTKTDPRQVAYRELLAERRAKRARRKAKSKTADDDEDDE